jgi:hypothetical protein
MVLRRAAVLVPADGCLGVGSSASADRVLSKISDLTITWLRGVGVQDSTDASTLQMVLFLNHLRLRRPLQLFRTVRH